MRVPQHRVETHLESEGEEAEDESGDGSEGTGTGSGEGRLGRVLASGLGLLGGGAVAGGGGLGGGLSGSGAGGGGLRLLGGLGGLGGLGLLGGLGRLGGLGLLGLGGVLEGLLADTLDLSDDGEGTGGTTAGLNHARGGGTLDLGHVVGLAAAVPVALLAVAGGGSGGVETGLGLAVAGLDLLGGGDSGEGGESENELHFDGGGWVY